MQVITVLSSDLLHMPAYQLHWGWIAGILIVAACLIWLLRWQRLWYEKHIRRLGRHVDQLLDGTMTRPAQPMGTGPIAELAHTLNQLAQRVAGKLKNLQQQHAELQAVLTAMVEGVIVVDLEMQVISMNDSAMRFLNIQRTDLRHRHLGEVIRNAALQSFVARAIQADLPIEQALDIRQDSAETVTVLHFQVHGSPLRDARGIRSGALIVLNDITRLVRIETVRRDFVANVSHELKTPIAAVKAAAETLEQAQHDDPSAAPMFIDMIQRQADRLATIIEDLLTLARLEQSPSKQTIERTQTDLCQIMQQAVDNCTLAAENNRITLVYQGNCSMTAIVNAPLLEQAITNLIDNAVKYAGDGATVTIQCQCSDQHALIQVEDNGIGIEPEHLDRIFERFYRPDKARSRDLGGTGLGLAIVKHVAQLHGGHVTVQSAPDQGACFTIHLPTAPPHATQSTDIDRH